MSTVTIAPTVEADHWPPRVKLDVTDSGTPTITSVTVVRINPDGTRESIPTDDGSPLPLTTSGSVRVGTIYDYLPPYGSPVTYSTEENSVTTSVPVTVGVDQAWLVHPGVPTLSQPIRVASVGTLTRKVRRGVFYPMGGKFAVVQTDGRRKAPEGLLEVRTQTVDELNTILDLLDDTNVLLLNIPTDWGWGLSHAYISIGDVDEDRLIDYAGDPNRYLSLPYVETERPEGGSRATWTMADIRDNFPTMADIRDAFPTMADIAAGL